MGVSSGIGEQAEEDDDEEELPNIRHHGVHLRKSDFTKLGYTRNCL